MTSKFWAWPVLTALLLMLGGADWRIHAQRPAIGGAENRSGTTTHDVAPVVANDDVLVFYCVVSLGTAESAARATSRMTGRGQQLTVILFSV